ncbi:MAG: DUF4097 domain-containing protein [Clostridiales bacterium]|nr:DUF4097 domain-containing protein [Clostridiales bacterium]
MKKGLVIILIGVGLTLLGGIIFAISMTIHGWDFNAVSTTEVVYETYESQSGEITGIDIDFSTADIVYQEYDGDKITVKYPIYKNKKGDKRAEVEITEDRNGILHINESTTPLSLWISIYEPKATVTVNVPKGKLEEISLHTNTGDVILGSEQTEINANFVHIYTDTGDINIKSKVNCSGRVVLYTDTGDLKVRANLIATTLTVESDTGDITFYKEIKLLNGLNVSTDTGDITINKVVASAVEIESSTGDINGINGGIDANEIEIETSTGDVKISLSGKKEDYSITTQVGTGKSNVSSYQGGNKRVEISSSTGNIEVRFIG